VKKLALGVALVAAAYAAGLAVSLHAYPRGEFARTWEAIVRDHGPNTWLHMRDLADETARRIVRPNNDTLYSYAAVDVEAGPWLVEAPGSDRYWSLEFIADNTDVFGYVGSRVLGLDRPARVVLAPAAFSGDAKGLTVLRSPSRRVWLMARFLVDGSDDLPRARRLQDDLRISRWNGD
jgi:hypothetical protein